MINRKASSLSATKLAGLKRTYENGRVELLKSIYARSTNGSTGEYDAHKPYRSKDYKLTRFGLARRAGASLLHMDDKIRSAVTARTSRMANTLVSGQSTRAGYRKASQRTPKCWIMFLSSPKARLEELGTLSHLKTRRRYRIQGVETDERDMLAAGCAISLTRDQFRKVYAPS